MTLSRSLAPKEDARPRFKLGEPVVFVASLDRQHHGSRRTWDRYEHAPQTGIVVGYRNRHDGRMESEYDEYSGRRSEWYAADRGFQTLLVAADLYRSAYVVLPADASRVDSVLAVDPVLGLPLLLFLLL